MTRPSLDETFVAVARTWALRSTCSRLQVGAVLARGGRTLSAGYNGAPSGTAHCMHHPASTAPCVVSVHAEANALAFAARHGTATEGATLYTTHSPCQGCAGLIVNAGIVEVVFAKAYRSVAGVAALHEAGITVRAHKDGVAG